MQKTNLTSAESQLFLAARHGDLDNVKKALKCRVNVEARDETGVTALLLARNGAVTKLLLDARANANAVRPDGKTPLHMAYDAEAVRLLLAAKANPTARDRSGWTPLHEAMTVEIAELLINAGADFNALTVDKQLPEETVREVGTQETEVAASYLQEQRIQAVTPPPVETTAEEQAKRAQKGRC